MSSYPLSHPESQCMRARSVLESRIRQGVAKGGTARYLVQDVLQFDLPIAARYKHLDVIRILQDNCNVHTGVGLDALIRALSILERYGKNLLKSDRPPQWRVVRLSNNIFKREVGIIKGAKNILHLLGYTKSVPDGLAYPEDCLVPDIPFVTSVTADILLLKQELTLLAREEHKQEKDFYPYIPIEEIKQAQSYYKMSSKNAASPVEAPPKSESVFHSHPIDMSHMQGFILGKHEVPRPPTYEDVLSGAGIKPTDYFQRNSTQQQLFYPTVDQHNNQEEKFHQAEVLQSPEVDVEEEDLCDICGQENNVFTCAKCDKGFCFGCNNIWHNHPKRKNHLREATKPKIPPIHMPQRDHNGGSSLVHTAGNPVFSSSLTHSPMAVSQEGAQGGNIDPPTISGARLPPTVTSKSTSLNDNDWDRKVNRMGLDLMDIDDKTLQKKKFEAFMNDLNTEKEKYNSGIQQLLKKGLEKPSLAAHFEERIKKIEDLKAQLKALMGYTDPSENVVPLTSPLNHHQDLNDPPNEHVTSSWSFKSVNSQSSVQSPRSSAYSASSEYLAHSEHRPPDEGILSSGQSNLIPASQRLEETPSVPVANLIDFSSEMSETTGYGPSENELTDNNGPIDLSSNHCSENQTLRNVDNNTQMKAARGDPGASGRTGPNIQDDPNLQGISVSMPESPSQGSLKRLLTPNDQEQPAKLQKGSTRVIDNRQDSEIATEFENMNIETRRISHSPNDTNIAYAFKEPHYMDETMVKDPLASPRILARNRLEESLGDFESFTLGLTPEELQIKMKSEEDRLQTTQFLDWIRAGDAGNFIPELVQVAVSELDKEGNLVRITPNTWIEKKWEVDVASFIEFAKTKNIIVSSHDAETSLLDHDNKFEDAVAFLEDEQKKLMGTLIDEYDEESVKRAMDVVERDNYFAACLLQKNEGKICYDAFNEEEGNGINPVNHLKKTFNVPNQERKSHAHLSNSLVGRREVCDAFEAILDVLQDDMRSLSFSDVSEANDNFLWNLDAALSYLNNECMICTEKFPQSKIMCLPTCGDNGCKYCLNCLQGHLTVCIKDKNIRDIVCPVCSKPDYKDRSELKTDFINHIDVIVRRMEDKRIHEIFQQKMRDFTLMRMPNFRWCSHCSGGFQWDNERENNLKMVCPFCRKSSCFKCKKKWEPQHDGISCGQFKLWKESNDPEFQAAGLARHLKENGIDCPDCNFRYALAKGGCMHFKCTQCSHEFCSGCNRPFKHGRACNVLGTCHSKGLHAHHPRDCLFYLRDCEPAILKKLLQENNVPFNTGNRENTRCQVMEQKETSSGMRDDICGKAVEENSAGLCRLHYNEYLVNLFNSHRIDPADSFQIDQLKTCLMREDIVVLPQRTGESNNAYRQRLLEEVKKLPLVKPEIPAGTANDMEP